MLAPSLGATNPFSPDTATMDKPLVVIETKPFDPQLEDLSTYLARIRSAAIRPPLTTRDCNELGIGVMAVLRKLEEMYAPGPV